MSDLKERILQFIRSHPGASTSAVRRGVSAKHARISEALSALEDAGKVRNRGNEHAHAWHAVSGSRNPYRISPDEAPAEAPEVIEGVRVACWMTPRAACEIYNITPRTLRRWERKGHPVWGSGADKIVPMPHSIRWAIEYRREKRRNPDGVSRLPMKLALARHNLHQVEAGEPPIYVGRTT